MGITFSATLLLSARRTGVTVARVNHLQEGWVHLNLGLVYSIRLQHGRHVPHLQTHRPIRDKKKPKTPNQAKTNAAVRFLTRGFRAKPSLTMVANDGR